MRASPDLDINAARLSISTETAQLRIAQFLKAMPPGLADREDTIQHKLASEHASSRNKLQKIYSLMTELGKVAEPYVACGKGCSACCQMNVMIYQLEANFIEKETGIKPARITRNLSHPLDEFLGVSCPFLKDGSCTIYEVRPFACRKHFSFDAFPYWCDPAHTLKVKFPMVGFSGVQGAFFDVARRTSSGLFADIRDFFS